MNEIKCPTCGTTFQISEETHDSIVKQIRDKEFERALTRSEEQYKKDLENAVKITQVEAESNLKEKLNEKDLKINKLESDIKSKENEITSQLNSEFTKKINKKDTEIAELKHKLELASKEQELTIKNALSEKDREIDKLKNNIETAKNEFLLKEQTMKEPFEEKIHDKDEQIAYYKDFKARQSTKMIGESLEQHCNNEFNKLRPLFKNSYFNKDNDVKTGSKGDFIFRDYSDDGVEIVSIMFEMKNEADLTATKHKNEDFFKELDKDRKEKNCEYAVLVSLLEIDNEYYNNGIVDVSHLYEKMYVIRPQFFIPLITLLRSMALKTLDYKKELQVIKNQNIDISHFEENMNTFKEGFNRNYRLASEKFKKAIEEIDKTIDHLQKTKDALISSENNLRLANNKAEDLTIKKLTHNSETMAELFANLKEKNDENIAA